MTVWTGGEDRRGVASKRRFKRDLKSALSSVEFLI